MLLSNEKKFEFGWKDGYFRTASFALSWRRDHMYELDMMILVLWGKVENPKQGQLTYKNFIHIGWNWLPKVVRFYDSTVDTSVYDSAAWTGRRQYMTKFLWDRTLYVKLARKERKEN